MYIQIQYLMGVSNLRRFGGLDCWTLGVNNKKEHRCTKYKCNLQYTTNGLDPTEIPRVVSSRLTDLQVRLTRRLQN